MEESAVRTLEAASRTVALLAEELWEVVENLREIRLRNDGLLAPATAQQQDAQDSLDKTERGFGEKVERLKSVAELIAVKQAQLATVSQAVANVLSSCIVPGSAIATPRAPGSGSPQTARHAPKSAGSGSRSQ